MKILRRMLLLFIVAVSIGLGMLYQRILLAEEIAMMNFVDEVVTYCESSLPRNQTCTPVVSAVVTLKQYFI